MTWYIKVFLKSISVSKYEENGILLSYVVHVYSVFIFRTENADISQSFWRDGIIILVIIKKSLNLGKTELHGSTGKVKN